MAGKGDKARNCHTKPFRDNYDNIQWGKRPLKKNKKTRCKSSLKTIKYYK